MLADFLKKYHKRMTAIGLAAWFLGVALLCGVVLQKEKILLQKSFYFLVSSSTHIQASTQFVEWSGGAGYLLEYSGCEQATFAVYLSEGDGLQVQAVLTEQDTKLVCMSVDCIYLYKKSDKQNRKSIQGAFQTLYNCCEVLEQIIDRFAKGGTQESGKRLLNTLQKQLSFLGEEYAKNFPQYADVCMKAAERISQLEEASVYLKDLRYLLCELCVSYVRLANSF